MANEPANTATAFISACPMGRTNGIGVQFLRQVPALPGPYHHFWWEAWDLNHSEVTHSSVLTRLSLAGWVARNWPFKRGGYKISQFLPDWKHPWTFWNEQELKPHKFDSLLEKIGKQFSVAVITPTSEWEAAHAVSIIRHLGCPFLVHMWDLTDAPGSTTGLSQSGLNPEKSPSFSYLFENAYRVLCLNEELAREVRKFQHAPIEIIPFGREPYDRAAAKDIPQFRIVLLGSLMYYPDGIALLAKAWSRLREMVPGAKIVYIGRKDQSRYLKAFLQSDIEYHEYPSDEDRDNILAGCQAAYLPGPMDPKSELGRFSVPCRTADYLHIGLPMISAVGSQTATAQFFEAISGKAFFRIDNVPELLSAVGELSSPARWEIASQAAIGFARESLNMYTIRQRISHLLDESAVV